MKSRISNFVAYYNNQRSRSGPDVTETDLQHHYLFALSAALRISQSSPSGRVNHAKRFKSICKKMAPINVFLAKKENQSRQFLTQNQVVENNSRVT